MSGKRYSVPDLASFKDHALHWAAGFPVACQLDSNGYTDRYGAFDILVAAGANYEFSGRLADVQAFLDEHVGWCPGFLSYDLKNELEDLQSERPDSLGFPSCYFFVPRHLVIVRNGLAEIQSDDDTDKLFSDILATPCPSCDPAFTGELKSRFSRSEYLDTVEHIREHIRRGDIYELNFCQEFFAESCSLQPLPAYRALNRLSPAPFSAFFRINDRYILSASPERFLALRSTKLISQPIKGTAAKTGNPEEDLLAVETLRNDAKERAENVMIVDLVRNDMTKSALPGSVRVEELFGIYSFGQVHQMISTVVGDVELTSKPAELLPPLFPMGSMTGAPKLRAMQLIEQYERTQRGIFSGAIGYFSPDGDFDFNVVIRTLLYNSTVGYLSFQAGSAITYESDPEKEYEECLLKVDAIRRVLLQS